jgi:predicted nucleic acid-binding protein
VYADTSALVKLVISEDGSSDMAALRPGLRVLACAHTGYAELRAAVAAAHRAGRLSARAFGLAKRHVESVWAATSPIEVDMQVTRTAGDLAELHALRGYGAIHLAALQRLGPPSGIDWAACWDNELRQAVAALGYKVFPT